jgi:hypothetical protein
MDMPNRYKELSFQVKLEVDRLINSLAAHSNSSNVDSVAILMNAQESIRKPTHKKEEEQEEPKKTSTPHYYYSNVQSYVEHFYEEKYDYFYEEDKEALSELVKAIKEKDVNWFKDDYHGWLLAEDESPEKFMCLAIVNTVDWRAVINYLKVYIYENYKW